MADIYKCTVKYYYPDNDYERCVDIKLVAAESMGDAISRMEDYYGEDLASVEVEPVCETRGVYDLGTIEDSAVIEELFADPCTKHGFKPETH